MKIESIGEFSEKIGLDRIGCPNVNILAASSLLLKRFGTASLSGTKRAHSAKNIFLITLLFIHLLETDERSPLIHLLERGALPLQNERACLPRAPGGPHQATAHSIVHSTLDHSIVHSTLDHNYRARLIALSLHKNLRQYSTTLFATHSCEEHVYEDKIV